MLGLGAALQYQAVKDDVSERVRAQMEMHTHTHNTHSHTLSNTHGGK